MIKRKHSRIKIIVTAVLLILICIVVYVNVYPPIYELENTYSCCKDIDKMGNEYYTFNRYYLVQNPPHSEEDLLQLTNEYICTNHLIENVADAEDSAKVGKKYSVSLIFCKKSYTPFGIHRLWHGKWDCDIESYGEDYIVMYHAMIEYDTVNMYIATNIDDNYHEIIDDYYYKINRDF